MTPGDKLSCNNRGVFAYNYICVAKYKAYHIGLFAMIDLCFRITVKMKANRMHSGPLCIVLRVKPPKGSISHPRLVIRNQTTQTKFMLTIPDKVTISQPQKQRKEDVSIGKVCITTTYVG